MSEFTSQITTADVTADVATAPAPERQSSAPVRARYDAAQQAGMNTQHWAAADGLDANLANSLAVRQRLTRRSRYEIGNNGRGKGIQLTQSHYVVGRGPQLRMQTADRDYNQKVETAWTAWCKAVRQARKLRTSVKAKVQDGESFLRIRSNPGLRDRVKLDITGIECEQCTTPYLGPGEPNKVDGIEFDEFGNRTWYTFLKQHPGGQWASQETERVAARYVLHLYREDRHGEQRAVPELSSSLNLFAVGRRWRESTLVAAENIANMSLACKTQQTPDEGVDSVDAFTTLPFQKGMMTFLPEGYDIFQPRPEQPAATYETFDRAQTRDTARPLSMSYNLAACDSSGYSFSGGKLDHLTYFVSVDVEQADIEDQFLDPLFAVWYEVARLEYGWTVAAEPTPAHTWDWPARPQIDEQKTASARKTSLGFGGTTLRQVYAEDGFDFEDELQAMAEDYGVTVDEMRRRLLDVILPRPSASGSTAPPPADDADDEDDEDQPAGRQPAAAGSNGNGRVRV